MAKSSSKSKSHRRRKPTAADNAARNKRRQAAKAAAKAARSNISHPFKLYRPSRVAQLLDCDPSSVWRLWAKKKVLRPPREVAGLRGWFEEDLAELMGKGVVEADHAE